MSFRAELAVGTDGHGSLKSRDAVEFYRIKVVPRVLIPSFELDGFLFFDKRSKSIQEI